MQYKKYTAAIRLPSGTFVAQDGIALSGSWKSAMAFCTACGRSRVGAQVQCEGEKVKGGAGRALACTVGWACVLLQHVRGWGPMSGRV